jgi:hypothetical protein
MQRILKVFQQWLPLAVLTVALCGLVYLAVQQVLRQAANDPQIQLAEDATNALAQGETTTNILSGARTVDIGQSLAPFLILYDESGKPVASSGLLHGEMPVPPPGVFEYTRANGQNRVTWQPEPAVRIAAVIQHFAGAKPGFVLAGRSLREVEVRENQVLFEALLAMGITLLALLFVLGANEFIFSTWLTRAI